MTTRRDIIKTALGAAAAMALPGCAPEAAAKLAATLEPVVKPPLLGWAVGTEGGMDWEPIFAPTEAEAVQEWLSIKGECRECPRLIPGSQDVCECYPDITSHRSPAFDRYAAAPCVPDVAKYHDGWCNVDCDRCGYANEDHAAHDTHEAVGEQVICHDCMTLADWRSADPEHAAELEDELLSDEYGEAVT